MPSRKSLPMLPEKVLFNYIKGSDFRTVHMDGAVGGPTPTGNLHFAIYSERFPIPQQLAQGISSTGELTDPIPETRVSREGIVRELSVDVVLSLPAAKRLRDWLNKNIDTLEDAGKVRKKARKS